MACSKHCDATSMHCLVGSCCETLPATWLGSLAEQSQGSFLATGQNREERQNLQNPPCTWHRAYPVMTGSRAVWQCQLQPALTPCFSAQSLPSIAYHTPTHDTASSQGHCESTDSNPFRPEGLRPAACSARQGAPARTPCFSSVLWLLHITAEMMTSSQPHTQPPFCRAVSAAAQAAFAASKPYWSSFNRTALRSMICINFRLCLQASLLVDGPKPRLADRSRFEFLR